MRTKFLIPILLILTLDSAGQCCDYFLNMNDSYGDGWNGGYIELLIDGLSQGTFAAEGNGSGVSFEVCPDQTIELIYTADDWENENTYQLVNASGLVVFSDGTYPTEGSVYNGTADCNITTEAGEVSCMAIPLNTATCVIADNSGFMDSGFDPGCANYQGEDIWFEMVVPPSGNLIINTNSTDDLNDTGLAIWESYSCAGLSLMDCDDDGGDDYFSFISLFNLEPGEIIYAQAWGYGGSSGSFEICMTDPGTVELESSELPIVDIHTGGQAIPDEPKINVLMRLIYNGPDNLTHVNDSANVYYGNVGIEIRGQSSSGYPQTPYGFETRDELGENNNVPLLGMPEENDWVLLSNYNDKTFVRNLLANHLFTVMGNYAPRMTLCEVRIDSLYKGIYLIGEKIKRDDGRVDIATLDSTENSGDEVTGGYIFKSDLAYGDNYWSSNYSPINYPGMEIRFVYHYPKKEDITSEQKDYLSSFMDSMETRLYSPEFTDPLNGYRSMMDVSSFIDYFLVNELSRNNDGFKKSRYYHKDRFSNGGRLKAGPTWDFDWAWKNINACSIFSQTDGSGWSHNINDCFTDNNSPGWYLRMLEDSTFADQLHCRYAELRSTIMDTTYLYNYIDSVATLLENAQERHYQKWPTLGINVGAPEVGPIPDTFQGEVDFLKDWIGVRIEWLDENMPGQCLASSIVDHVEDRLSVYPNPSSGQVIFQGDLQNVQVQLYNLQGFLLDKFKHGNNSSLNYRFKDPGVYFYRLSREGKEIQTGKVVIQNR